MLAVTSEAIAFVTDNTEPDKAVTLCSILLALALLDVTNPAKAVSLVVSTELIKETISANVSVSATEAVKIASILNFSVLI